MTYIANAATYSCPVAIIIYMLILTTVLHTPLAAAVCGQIQERDIILSVSLSANELITESGAEG